MSALQAGRWRVEARVSFSGAASNVQPNAIVSALRLNMASPQNLTGGMFASDPASNPNVVIVRERAHDRRLVTVAMVLDISSELGWDRASIARDVAFSLTQAGCAEDSVNPALVNALLTGRAVSTNTNAPVTTAHMTFTRTGGYAASSVAAALYRPLPGMASGSGGGTGGRTTARVGTSATIVGKGGSAVSYTPAQLAEQLNDKRLAIFDAVTGGAGAVAPASIPLDQRVGLDAIVGATNSKSVGADAGLASAEAVADVARSGVGKFLIALGILGIVGGVVVLIRES